MMDQTAVVKGVLAGQFLAVGEYRMSKAENISWRDQKTGRPMTAPICRHVVEFGDKSVTVNERVPDGTKVEDISIPFVKGDLVVLHIDELTSTKGVVGCRGRLEKFDRTPSPAKAAPGGGGTPARS